jgi:hypothetical protein
MLQRLHPHRVENFAATAAALSLLGLQPRKKRTNQDQQQPLSGRLLRVYVRNGHMPSSRKDRSFVIADRSFGGWVATSENEIVAFFTIQVAVRVPPVAGR